jgi:hypothetical protein
MRWLTKSWSLTCIPRPRGPETRSHGCDAENSQQRVSTVLWKWPFQILSQSHFTKDVHSDGMSWCRTPFRAHVLIFNGFWQAQFCRHGASPLTKGCVCRLSGLRLTNYLTTLMNGANLWYIQHRLTKPVPLQACLADHAVTCLASATAAI